MNAVKKEKKEKKRAANAERPQFNPFDGKFNPKEDAITLFTIVAVCFVQCLAISAFYTPNRFLSTGITGIAVFFEYLWHFPKYLTVILLNIPILIFGFRQTNLTFMIFSTIATACYALFFEIPFVVNIGQYVHLGQYSEILSALIGPVVLGFSGVFVVKRGASLGGMDVLSVILSRKFSIQMGTINMAYNFVIMVFLGIAFGAEKAVFSMAAVFIANTAFNYAMRGFNRNMSVFIISKEWDEIAPHVLNEMHRGVTYLHGEGAYTGEPRNVVYCIVKTTELSKLRSIVKRYDPNALFSIIETKEVIGRGFGLMN